VDESDSGVREGFGSSPMPGKYVAGTHSGPQSRFSPPQSLGYHAEVRLLIADFWLLIEDRLL